MQHADEWRPSATLETLRQRAALLQQTRAFFAARNVLEVDTPILARYGVTDVHLTNLETRLAGDDRLWYLQTSPEFAMKRLLAAGSGCIYQLGKVFRDDEQSPRHNPEFTLLEWYRVGFSMADLIAEVSTYLQQALGFKDTQQFTYAQVFATFLKVEIFAEDGFAQLQKQLLKYPEVAELAQVETDFTTLQQLAMSFIIEPQLPINTIVFVTHYPILQAALAAPTPDDLRTAQRFEVFVNGLELANGYFELTDAAEQTQRFSADQKQRQQSSRPAMQADPRLLAALQSGLPACAGVALGFDRLVMLASRASHIRAILPFAIDRA